MTSTLNKIFFAVGMVVSTHITICVAQTTPLDLIYERGYVSIDTENQPLADVLNLLSEKSNMQVKYLIAPESLPHVNLSLDNVEFAKTLAQLLKGLNHMIFYGSGNQSDPHRVPEQVWILGTDIQHQQINLVDHTEFQSMSDKKRSHTLLHLVNEKSMSTEDLVNTLSKSLIDDPSPLVRTRAVIALAKLNTPLSLSALETALRDESQSVRTQAIMALGKMGSTPAIELLGHIIMDNTDSLNRHLAVRALSKTNSPIARRYLDLAGYDYDTQVSQSATTQQKLKTKNTVQRHNNYSQ